MRFSNRAIGLALATAMLALMTTAILIRKFGDYPSLMETSPPTAKP
ncbi:hypothetical protein K2X85_03090 [bacterium]|jgi:hypothetical protein|nr:hypothetical protein [bacterium]